MPAYSQAAHKKYKRDVAVEKSIAGSEKKEYGSWWEQYRRLANDEAKRSMPSPDSSVSGSGLSEGSGMTAYAGSYHRNYSFNRYIGSCLNRYSCGSYSEQADETEAAVRNSHAAEDFDITRLGYGIRLI